MATVVILHGIVSHAGWLDSIAVRLAEGGIDVVCPDRRGCGRNPIDRGDAPSGGVLLEDLDRIVTEYLDPNLPLHLCGFCWGAVYALRYLGAPRPAVRSLLLLAPGLYPSRELTDLPLVTGDSAEATEEPLTPLDAFTSGPALHEQILPDPLRLDRVSPRFNAIVAEFYRLVTPRLARLLLPVLCVVADADRITDNDATRRAFELVPGKPKKLATVPGQHGVQFDAPDQSARLIHEWIAAANHDFNI
jgi:alpha-beta hydrolase superfamily lysophospholipase